jgi:hypothetical protein
MESFRQSTNACVVADREMRKLDATMTIIAYSTAGINSQFNINIRKGAVLFSASLQ